MQTGAGSGKVERVRATSRVTLVPSDQRGALRGVGVAGIARVLDGAEAAVAERALQQKYGLRRRLFFLAARLAARLHLDLPGNSPAARVGRGGRDHRRRRGWGPEVGGTGADRLVIRRGT